jgi:hypothetical protein
MKKLAENATVSEMKLELMKLGYLCTVSVWCAAGVVSVEVEAEHESKPKLRRELALTEREYLAGPMQPVYFSIWQEATQ